MSLAVQAEAAQASWHCGSKATIVQLACCDTGDQASLRQAEATQLVGQELPRTAGKILADKRCRGRSMADECLREARCSYKGA